MILLLPRQIRLRDKMRWIFWYVLFKGQRRNARLLDHLACNAMSRKRHDIDRSRRPLSTQLNRCVVVRRGSLRCGQLVAVLRGSRGRRPLEEQLRLDWTLLLIVLGKSQLSRGGGYVAHSDCGSAGLDVVIAGRSGELRSRPGERIFSDERKHDEVRTTKSPFTLLNSLWFPTSAIMRHGCNTSPELRSPIESIEDLAKQTEVLYGCFHSGSTEAFFKDFKPETYERMWNAMKDDLVSSNDEGVERVERGGYAFLMESTSNEYVAQRRCELTQLRGLLDSKGYGIAMPQGMC
ncbi:hypothetical protein HPB51_024586 [Rhipicephalus microplus]|uniref:Ionotropic glutamate receptor C-terminal domain-containing protein n=1 Tax=Rhipicephalus microplus TaxID=6941 RepID=A0A9J6DK32_RHIMP|nr:hypothetical protein HPB51_024586 [Rhipicephalus microplus]